MSTNQFSLTNQRNNQQPQGREVSSELLVHSMFWTIQGEGPFSGHPALFIRLGGCNIQCPGCDTEYSEGSEYMTLDQILCRIPELVQNPTNCECLVVITGGEPFRQYITSLCLRLLRRGHLVQIETNGTLSPGTGDFPKEVVVVCSPKTGRVHPELLPFIGAYKYVIEASAVDPDDGLPTSVLGGAVRPARPHPGYNGPVYLSPMDSQNPEVNAANLQALVTSCLKHSRLASLQIHKLLSLP